jgi:hypothetical protein
MLFALSSSNGRTLAEARDNGHVGGVRRRRPCVEIYERNINCALKVS